MPAGRVKEQYLAEIEMTDNLVLARSSHTSGADTTAAPVSLPTEDTLQRRFSDFSTMGEALDYAATGARGFNFHDARGNLARPYSYAELRSDAIDCAYRLIASGIKPEDRIALVAETGTEFAQMFFGVIYAGAWPVPLPLPTSFGGKESYIDQLSVQLQSCDPKILFFPSELEQMAGEAACRASPSNSSSMQSLRPAPCLRPIPTISPICSTAAAQPAFRMALR